MDSCEDLNRDKAPKAARAKPPAKRKDYTVGYARPPAEHRFAKGRSGNPGGRRKKVELVEGATAPERRSIRDMYEDVAFRTVRLRQGEGAVELPLIEAAFLEVGLKAAKGSRLALATLVQLATKLGVDDFVAPEPADVMADYLAVFEAASDAQDAQHEASRAAVEAREAEEARARAEEEEIARRVQEEAARRVEEEVARRLDAEVQRRMAEEVDRRVEAEARRRVAEVEEALAYKQIWRAAIEVAGGIGFELEEPAPHPDEVVIDTEHHCVRYTVPVDPDRGATLANLRAALSRLRQRAADYELHLSRAVTTEGEAISRGRRDGARRVAGVIEGMLSRMGHVGRDGAEGGEADSHRVPD